MSTSAAHKVSRDATQPLSAYSQARSAERQAARERIHVQVLHPIDTPSLLRDPLCHHSSRIDSTITSLKLLFTAVAVHGFIILLFAALNDLMGEKMSFQPPERVTVQVVEKTPPPPPKVEPEPEEVQGAIPDDFIAKEPEVIKELKPPERKPPREERRKQVKLDKPEPPPASPEPPDNAPPKRRVIGASFESTVTGGNGPSLATGTSRMGTTGNTAEDPIQAAKRTNGTSTKPGTGTTSEAPQEQRTASNIPTRDAVFVKPKRSKPSKPPYPETLKAQGIEGDVQLRVSIDAKGRVTDVVILQSSGQSAFDNAAKSAAFNESFEPATRDGKPVAYTLSYSYRFRIEEN